MYESIIDALETVYDFEDVSNDLDGMNFIVDQIRQTERDDIVFKFDGHDRLHSSYSTNHYIPAISIKGFSDINCYLFQGEVCNCVHPMVITSSANITYVEYYSTERDTAKLPYHITRDVSSNMVSEVYRDGTIIYSSNIYAGVDFTKHEMIQMYVKLEFTD